MQLSYNLLDREAEQRLLPLAQERGIGVIVNRPFREGALLQQLSRHRLPGWAAEIDCEHWAQVALKFVVSHPAVDLRDPGHQPGGASAAEHGRRARPDARRSAAQPHGPRRGRAVSPR